MGWLADDSLALTLREQWESWLRLAVMTTGNLADAEDAVQEAAIALSRVWRRLDDSGRAAYVRRTIINKSIDVLRRRRELPVPAFPDEGSGGNLLRYQQDRDFFALLSDLPDHERIALVCRFYLQLDDSDTAQMLGCPSATVRSRIHRGLTKLRTSHGCTGTRKDAT